MLIPFIIPFNLIKALANSAVTFLLYKSVGSILKIENSPGARSAAKADARK
jgi:riboflavin transporter FmnP